PPMQRPCRQLSCSLHALPSSHGVPSWVGGLEHKPVAGLHTPASWHWSDALQVTGVPPWHCPAWQVSPCVHRLPSSHAAPSAVSASAGQVSAEPSQRSAASQAPVDGRHSSVRFWSAGQVGLVPEQLSATSQSPAAARQIAVLFTSAGHAASVPVQNSATSQAPAAARHLVVAGLKVSAGQVALVPVQNSD